MAKDDEDEFEPTEEQTAAYIEISAAYIGLAAFDSMTARLPPNSVKAHTFHPDCLVYPTLGQSMAVVELEDKTIGIAVPPAHKHWINAYPIDFIAISRNEVFLVSKSFQWLGSEHPVLSFSLGPMVPSDLLAMMCNQKSVQFYAAENIANPKQVTLIRPDAPVLVYHVLEGTPLVSTRKAYETTYRAENADEGDAVRSHFLGS